MRRQRSGRQDGDGSVGYRMKRQAVRTLRTLRIPVCRYPPSTSWEYHVRELMRKFRINCVFDVGAHRGEFVERIRQDVRYGGTVLSFEPAGLARTVLFDRWSHDPHWHGLPYALGAVDERRHLKSYPMSLLNSFRIPSAYGKREWQFEECGSEEVEVRTVDGIVAHILPNVESDPRIFLKIDTQGFDLSVVEGAQRSFSLIPALQLEVPLRPLYEGVPTLEGTLPILRDLGYEVSAMFPVARDPKDGLRLVEIDCILVRSDTPR